MRRTWLTTLGYTLAVLVFFIASTYAVLYATGYKIDWQTWALKKTGFILIETYPKNANIKLNNKDTSKTTPETIKRLLPGTYQVELTKDSYRPWQGDIVVESGLVTESRNILLTLQDLKPTTLFDLPVSNLSGNLDNTKIALLIGKDIFLWDIKAKSNSGGVNASLIRQQIKDRNTTEIANGKLVPLGWGPDNQTLLFRSQSSRNQYYLTLDTTSGVIKLIVSGNNITNLRWISEKEIAWLQNNELSLLNLSSGKIQSLSSKIIDYTWLDNNLYVASKNAAGKIIFARLSKAGVLEEELAELPAASGYYFGKIKNNWLVISTLNTVSSIWLEDRSTGKLTWKSLATNVKSKVLWDEKYLIYKQGEQLTKVEWEKLDQPPVKLAQLHGGELSHFSFDTILYVENQLLKSIDLTGQNQYDLVPLKDAAQLILSEPQISKIIFIDAKTNQLTEATLREKTNILF